MGRGYLPLMMIAATMSCRRQTLSGCNRHLHYVVHGLQPFDNFECPSVTCHKKYRCIIINMQSIQIQTLTDLVKMEIFYLLPKTFACTFRGRSHAFTYYVEVFEILHPNASLGIPEYCFRIPHSANKTLDATDFFVRRSKLYSGCTGKHWKI